MDKNLKAPDLKDILDRTRSELGREIGLNNNEIGEKVTGKGDLATRIAGGYLGGQMTKNIIENRK
ncbi:MAG: alpha/beta-type small acid-soluble spore protein [Clostridia bacterium]|nr:alpha/beta-type small acid-soluble spore protein [Clostridia bacterium]